MSSIILQPQLSFPQPKKKKKKKKPTSQNCPSVNPIIITGFIQLLFNLPTLNGPFRVSPNQTHRAKHVTTQEETNHLSFLSFYFVNYLFILLFPFSLPFSHSPL